MLSGVPTSPFPVPSRATQPASPSSSPPSLCWLGQSWPGHDPPHPPGTSGELCSQLGRREGEGHIGHLPRRQRKVRRGGGFILGGGGEVSRGQRSRAAGEGSERGASDLRAPPQLVKYWVLSTPHH